MTINQSNQNQGGVHNEVAAPWDDIVLIKKYVDWFRAHESELQQIAARASYLLGSFPQGVNREEARDPDRGVAPD